MLKVCVAKNIKLFGLDLDVWLTSRAERFASEGICIYWDAV